MNTRCMKLMACAITLAASASLHAAGYSKAEITRLHNDVKVLKENVAPKTASVGQEINPVTSVATGPDSRAELRFPDQSLTRLGSNSRFTLRGDARTIDLEKGTMLLQVPEQIRGAKVRTAAVTAAVTGGTAMIEYLPGGYIKLIVIEGFVDLVMNNDPSNFKQFKAGQMLIMKADGSSIPDAVDVDLKVILKTSKLIKSDDQSGINQGLVDQAVQQQQQLIQSGELQPTNLVIPGQGTYVVVNTDNSQVTNIFNNFTLNNGDTPPPGTTPGTPGEPEAPPQLPPGQTPFHGFAPLIAGKTILNDNGTILTNPHVTGADNIRNNTLSQLNNASGIVYRGLADPHRNRAGDGLFQYFAFGDTNIISPDLQPMLNDKGYWAVFKFEDLFINGTPQVVIGAPSIAEVGPIDPVISNVILASQNGIRLGADAYFPDELPPTEGEGGGIGITSEVETTLDLAYTDLTNLVLYAQNGDIIVRGNALYGYDQDVSLVSAGADVRIEGNIVLESGGEGVFADLMVVAGRDIVTQGATVSSDNISMEARRDVAINSSTIETRGGQLNVKAVRHINITNSSELKSLINGGTIHLETAQGDINVINSSLMAPGGTIDLLARQGNIALTGATTSSDFFKAQTLGANGWITIGNSNINAAQLLEIYAKGANGGVRFVDNTTLTSNQIKIEGNTVEIVNGKVVNVNGALDVKAVNKHYNGAGNTAANKGTFIGGGLP